MNPRAEAFERLGAAYDVRVLEPSPPSVERPPWFADDPTARGSVAPGRRVVSPVTSGDLLWEELAAADPDLAGWCADRWLGPLHRLGRVPPALAETRRDLHSLAWRVMGPVRKRANGQSGLRWTRGGFGTPYFGAGAQVRVEHGALVVQSRFRERRAPVTTLAAAAEFIGFDGSREATDAAGAPLVVDPGAAAFIGDFLGFATNVLEQLRADVPPEYEPSRVELSPESFNLTVEMGLEHAGRRAAFGASLGDWDHPEPYMFVTPLDVHPTGDLWQADTFTGARLSYRALRAEADQRACALDFVRSRIEALHHPLLPR